jgi:hypothetical protein
MVHPGGRPRTSSPSPEECIELGKDLVEWVTEETTEKRLLFSQWWSLKQGMLKKEWKALKEIPQFLPYYEQAQSALALKAIDGTMEKSFGHRYIRLYDRELIEEENNQARFDAELKKMSTEDISNLLVEVISYKKTKESQ